LLYKYAIGILDFTVNMDVTDYELPSEFQAIADIIG